MAHNNIILYQLVISVNNILQAHSIKIPLQIISFAWINALLYLNYTDRVNMFSLIVFYRIVPAALSRALSSSFVICNKNTQRTKKTCEHFFYETQCMIKKV